MPQHYVLWKFNSFSLVLTHDKNHRSSYYSCAIISPYLSFESISMNPSNQLLDGNKEIHYK